MIDTTKAPGLRLIQLQRRHTRPDLDPLDEDAPHWAWRYVAAVLLVGLAAFVNASAPDFLGKPVPFFVFFPAIVLSGFIGGFGPGFAATWLSAGAVAYLNFRPHGSFEVAHPHDVARLALFIAVGTLMSYVKHVLHSAVRRARRTEEALALEIRQRGLVTDLMPGLVSYIDADHRYVYCNRVYEDWFGQERSRLVGRRMPDVIGAAAYAQIRPRLDAALAGRSVRYTAELAYKTGARWVDAQYVPDVASDGRVRGVVSLVLDVGERRASEEAVTRGERQLRTIIDEMPFLISYIDREERYVFNNRRYSEWFGRTPAELKGKSVREVLGEERWGTVRAQLRDALDGRPVVLETRVAYADRPRWIRAEFVPDREPGGAVRGVFAFVSDVSDRRRQEESLKEAVASATEELARSNAELEAFSYTVSHDLRAPLRAIQGYAHFVEERARGKLDGETMDLLGRIGGSTARMDRMIQDLLTLGRISRGDASLRPVALEPVVDHVLSHYSGFEKARVSVRRPLGRVLAQDSLLTQALSNLLVNAAKFVPKGRAPVIEVRAEPGAPGFTRVVVKDNGIGVPEELRGKLFRPFSRLHPRGEYEGTGMGLAIVKKAVERMGGTAGVEPAPEGGSMFWIELRSAP